MTRRLGSFVAVPDDGTGERQRLQLTDPDLRQRLSAGVHTLRFRSPASRRAYGLCIYGDYRVVPRSRAPTAGRVWSHPAALSPGEHPLFSAAEFA